MKFNIELVTTKQNMVAPKGIPKQDGFVLPILERDIVPGSVEEASYTVLEGGEIVAGQDRREGWLYEFTWWTYCEYPAPQVDKDVSGSIVEITDVNHSYGYATHVLVNQQ